MASCHGRNRHALKGELAGNWYKHYSGMAGGRPVEVDLHHYDDVLIGTCYFTDSGMLMDIADAEDPGSGHDAYLTMFSRTNREMEDENFEVPHWAVDINGPMLAGDLLVRNKKERIECRESYANGSVPLAMLVAGDSATVKKEVTTTHAISMYQVLQCAKGADAAFATLLDKAQYELLGTDSPAAATMEAYLNKENEKYFDSYHRLVADMKIDRKQHPDDAWVYNFYHSRNIWAVYNRHNLLVLELHAYDYMGNGSGRGSYINNYVCVDAETKRIWHTSDILRMDAAILQPLLAAEARRCFHIKAGDTLTSRLTTGTIPLTQNILPTDKGLLFCYNPTLVAQESDGEVALLIPYTLLLQKGLLQPAFLQKISH